MFVRVFYYIVLAVETSPIGKSLKEPRFCLESQKVHESPNEISTYYI